MGHGGFTTILNLVSILEYSCVSLHVQLLHIMCTSTTVILVLNLIANFRISGTTVPLQLYRGWVESGGVLRYLGTSSRVHNKLRVHMLNLVSVHHVV